MSGGLKVTVAGLDFFGQGVHDFVIDPDGFDGWDDGVDMRLEQLARPQAHGAFDLQGYQDARTVSISGHVLADSNGRLRLLRSRLTGLLAGGGSGRVQVERDGEVMWADCRLASRTKFTELGGTDTASFQIQLWCPNPLKYGDTNTYSIASGSAYTTVSHRGNTVGYPVVKVSGDMPGGYLLQSSAGAEYRVTTALVSGSPHTVDMSTGLLSRGGSIVSGGVTRADLWRIAGGSPATDMRLQPITTGSGTATVSLLDTYI